MVQLVIVMKRKIQTEMLTTKYIIPTNYTKYNMQNTLTIPITKYQGGSAGDRDEEEDPDGDVDHLLAHHPPPWHHLRHHLLQADVLRGG